MISPESMIEHMFENVKKRFLMTLCVLDYKQKKKDRWNYGKNV